MTPLLAAVKNGGITDGLQFCPRLPSICLDALNALLGLAEGAAFYWDTRDNQRRTLTVIRVEQDAVSDG